jgi:PAS domain S-box-containing protein
MESKSDRQETGSNQQGRMSEVHTETDRLNPPDLSSVQSEDIPKLVHQLHVQQVQLEMQNEELRQSQQTLAEACDHYTQLYDFSPAGYMTLTPEGVIEEANLRFCAMIGVNRTLVLGRRFSDFVMPQEWESLQRHYRDVLTIGTTQTCKLRLLPKAGHPLVMHVESLRGKERDKPDAFIQVAMLDITLMDRAEQTLRDNQRKVQHTAAKLLTAQDEERRRIARDLHDDYCQRLAVLILEVGMLPKRHPAPWSNPGQQLQPLKATLSTLLSDLRELSHDLHPDQTASVALDKALETYLADFSEKTQVVSTFHMAPRPLHIPAAIGTCLYRIAQEGLANVRKHARAKRVGVTVNGLPDAIELLINDDGQGFVPETVTGSHHLGLTSMRERVEQFNGTMTIRSRPEWGTTISILIPLPHIDTGGRRGRKDDSPRLPIGGLRLLEE